MDKRAEAYEKLYPGTGIGEAQAIERYELMEAKRRRGESGRRSRFVTVPELPWHKEKA